jgi:N-acetylglutamate synthase-like GNAT family acetyltransferase
VRVVHQHSKQVGGELVVRDATSADARPLADFLATLAPGSRPLGLFDQAGATRIDAYWASPGRSVDHFGVVAEDLAGQIVGHAAYIRLYGPRAELVLDLAQHVDRPALAKRLIERLSEVARANGIRRFITTGSIGHGDLTAIFFGGRTDASGSTRAVIEFATAGVTDDQPSIG